MVSHHRRNGQLSLSFTEELIEQSFVETVTIACVSNEVGGDLVGNAEWTFPSAQFSSRQESTQKRHKSSAIPLTDSPPNVTEVALDGRTALIATAMNGSPLPTAGFPTRCRLWSLWVCVGHKMAPRLELTTWEAADGYWIPRGWSKKRQSRSRQVDVPRHTTISAGLTPVAGIALAVGRYRRGTCQHQ